MSELDNYGIHVRISGRSPQDQYLDSFLDFSPWDDDETCHYCGASKGDEHAACLWASARTALGREPAA